MSIFVIDWHRWSLQHDWRRIWGRGEAYLDMELRDGLGRSVDASWELMDIRPEALLYISI